MLADFSQKKPGRGCCLFVRCLLERPFGVTSEERELGAERSGLGMLGQKGWKMQAAKDISRLPINNIKRYWKPEGKLLQKGMDLEGTYALAVSFLGARIIIPKLIKSQEARKTVRRVYM